MHLLNFFIQKSDVRSLFSARNRTGRAVLFYLVIAGIWFFCTSRIIDQFLTDTQNRVWAQTVQGWVLIALSSVILFILLRQSQARSDGDTDRSDFDPLRFEGVMQMVPVGMAVVRDQVIMTANARLSGITGYEQEELIGMNCCLLYAEAGTCEADMTRRLQERRDSETGALLSRWVRKDGAIVPVRLHFSLLNPANPKAGLLFTVTDTTASGMTEVILAQQKDLYRFFVQSADDGILICDRTGTVLLANQAVCNLLCLTNREVVGQLITSLPLTMPDRSVWPFFRDQMRQGQTVRVDGILAAAADMKRPVDVRIMAVSDGSYLLVFQDVTRSSVIEKALRESEEKFALAFASSTDAILISRLTDGVLVETNRGFTELTGYSREEAVGLSTVQLQLWSDPADRDRLISQLYARGYCENMEAVFRCKDGSCGTGSITSRLLELNDVLHVVSTIRDITKRKQTEIDLKRLEVAIEQAGEVVVITDIDGSIVYANPAFSKVTGYTREEVLGKNPRVLKSGEHDEAFYQELWRVISSGNTWNGRMVNRKKDGTLYTEEATISPIINQQGHIVNYVAIKRDITAHLKLEAQYLHAQKMESIGRLTSGVAHDFNNILTVIIGYCEMAMTKAGSGLPVCSDLEEIHKASLRSADIVGQLRTFSRNQPVSPKFIDLNETVAGVLSMLQRSIGERIELLWQPGEDLPLVRMDPGQLDQVLVNLCVNARDAVQSSGLITLRTGCVHLDAAYCAERDGLVPGQYVGLYVTDTGCGIDPALLDRIFEPFFTTKGVLGTGLGLSTVYGIVQQNKGCVDVQSTPGQGTTFLVYLPVHDPDKMTGHSATHNVPSQGQGERVLLVEGDSSVLALGQFILENLGYRVMTAATPERALQLVEHHGMGFDLLVTDLFMPFMSGKELAARLKSRYPGLKVVFMSSGTAGVTGNGREGASDGCFLQKPFTLTTMAESVRSALAVC
ncbi:MAG: PAS domain S-box protein [Desulfobulbus sp.]|nr:PAS domain S-box protein [Desulfobulbus sp.]